MIMEKERSIVQMDNSIREDDEYTIDLNELILKLLDKWRIIAVVSLLTACLFAVYSVFFITPTYEATSKLYVVNSKDSVVNLSDFQISNYLADDYKQVFNNWHVHEMVLDRLNLDYSYKELNEKVSVSNPSGTRILCITASSEDPTEAQTLANTYADVAREFICVTMQTAEPTTFEEALLPTSPASPNKTKNTLLGFVIGFVLSVGIITLRFIMDDYVRTADDVEKYLGLPVLGVVMLQDEESEDDEKKSNKRKAGDDDE